MCVRQYGDAPEVEIKGRLDLVFSYIPSHLYYMLFEVRARERARAGADWRRASCGRSGARRGVECAVRPSRR